MTREEQRIEQIEQFASQCYEDGERYSSFIAGAIWADNNPVNVWHDVSEIPKDNSHILILYTYNEFTELKSYHINYKHLVKWSDFVDFNGIECWAYVSDLLPKGGEK